ncbi:MAG: stage 0 sporulation family protein [Clostridiales bacterium]|nr:stage 0 sporulation family protein [Clostridiales bacterium]MDO4349945.1 stage 0 sporulation family protein [Eubacteriales bacterium]MDY4008167.1 stage 0 sporulation family protein [Candidatus Limiplasma sp.]
MATVVGVRFKNAGKLYYFDPGTLWPAAGSFVVVETARGVEYGQVITGVREVDDELIASPLKQVLRIGTDEDAKHAAENERFEKEAYRICQHKIEEHKLDMKLVGVEQTFDNAKILFYFTANGRVDFRSLVKDLASVFHTRIELRQIGVRDEAKMLGGLGPCGRPICCGSFLGDFQPVSIKMAKEQNLSLNPTKISGVCGRLMCCLKFEQDHYESTRKRMPKVGKEVETPEGVGVVVDINVLKETLTVRIHKGDTSEFKVFPLEEVKWARPASQPCEGRNPEGKQPEQRGARAQARRTRQNRPLISSDDETPAPTDEELPLETEEEMQPVDQSNDWLKAVEEALNAAKDKE